MTRLNSRLTSATVSAMRPGSSGGRSSGLVGSGGRVEVLSRIAEAVTAQIASAVMPTHPKAQYAPESPGHVGCCTCPGTRWHTSWATAAWSPPRTQCRSRGRRSRETPRRLRRRGPYMYPGRRRHRHDRGYHWRHGLPPTREPKPFQPSGGPPANSCRLGCTRHCDEQPMIARMARTKRKTLPRDFEELVAAGDLDALKGVFDRCLSGPLRRGLYHGGRGCQPRARSYLDAVFIVHDGRIRGAVAVTKRSGEALSAAERRLVGDLARSGRSRPRTTSHCAAARGRRGSGTPPAGAGPVRRCPTAPGDRRPRARSPGPAGLRPRPPGGRRAGGTRPAPAVLARDGLEAALGFLADRSRSRYGYGSRSPVGCTPMSRSPPTCCERRADQRCPLRRRFDRRPVCRAHRDQAHP